MTRFSSIEFRVALTYTCNHLRAARAIQKARHINRGDFAIVCICLKLFAFGIVRDPCSQIFWMWDHFLPIIPKAKSQQIPDFLLRFLDFFFISGIFFSKIRRFLKSPDMEKSPLVIRNIFNLIYIKTLHRNVSQRACKPM